MSEALRKAAEQALEMLGHCTPDKRYGDDYLEREFAELNAVRKALRAALAEPEQEPVAYELYATKFANGRQLVYKVPESLASYIKVRNLYDHPPRREPLSDEQLQAGVRAWFENDIVPGQYPFSRRMRAAIEAAHGITGEKT